MGSPSAAHRVPVAAPDADLTEEEQTTRYLRRVAARERARAQTALHVHVRQVRRDLGLRP